MSQPTRKFLAGISLTIIVAIAAFFLLRTQWSDDLHKAAEAGDLAAVERLIEAGADVDQVRKRTTGWQVGEPLRRVETSLFMAARGGHTEIIRTLLEAGADPDIICTGGSTALIAATGSNRRGDYTEIIRLLLDAGADPIGPRSRGRTALHWGAMRGEYESFLLLLEASRAAGFTPEQEREIVPYLQHRNDDLAHLITKVLSDATPTTELHTKARLGSDEELQAMLEAGIDPNPADTDGWTPLLWAAGFEGNNRRVVLLLGAGADPSAATGNGYTPLMAAVQTNDIVRVRALLDAEADVNAADMNDRTVLHIAAWRGTPEMIDLLLQAGASPHSKNRWTQVPADLADARKRNLGEDVTAAFQDLPPRD